MKPITISFMIIIMVQKLVIMSGNLPYNQNNFLKNYNSQLDEKALSPKQKKIAAAAPPEDKITGADFAALRKEKSSNLSESQQLQSLEQQAKDFVSKYGKVKVKI